jgi:hypothetical protein
MGLLRKTTGSEVCPNPVLDFELIDESIYIKYYNFSDIEAYNISVEFSHSIPGFHGTKKISSLYVFRGLSYMAPHKEFLIYVDDVGSFFEILNIDSVRVDIKYQNRTGKKYSKNITHNLLVYKDMPIIIKSNKL